MGNSTHRLRTVALAIAAAIIVLVGLYLTALWPSYSTELATRSGPNWVDSGTSPPTDGAGGTYEQFVEQQNRTIRQGFERLNESTHVSGAGQEALRIFVDSFPASAAYWFALDVRADGTARASFMGSSYGDENDHAGEIEPTAFDLSSEEVGPFLYRFDDATQAYTGRDIPQNILFDGTTIGFERRKMGALFSGGGPAMPGKTFDRVSDDVLGILWQHLPSGMAPGPNWRFPKLPAD